MEIYVVDYMENIYEILKTFKKYELCQTNYVKIIYTL